jgi:hypothetical protein
MLYHLSHFRLSFRPPSEGGAESQDRTGDTAIFSRVLYQLSYLGPMANQPSAARRRVGGYHGPRATINKPALHEPVWPTNHAWTAMASGIGRSADRMSVADRTSMGGIIRRFGPADATHEPDSGRRSAISNSA